MHQHSLFREITLDGVSLNPRKEQPLLKMPPPNSKKEMQLFLGILNYLSKFSPITTAVCKPLWKLTSVKVEWSWSKMYQDQYDKNKKIIRQDTCMTFYDMPRALYLETDASGVCLGDGFLQIREGKNCGHNKVPDNVTLQPTAFVSKACQVQSSNTAT